MGWTDSHLHDFASGKGRDAEYYRPQDSLDNDLPGVDEMSVRLDEVLVDPGDRLYYTYDLGDDWSHTLRLEAVSPRAAEQPAAVCLAGARACPPEDCGGIWSYSDLLAKLGDPSNPDNAELLEWVGPGFDPERFDVGEVNAALAQSERFYLLHDNVLMSVDPAGRLGELLSRVDVVPPELLQSIDAAIQPVDPPDLETKSLMLERFSAFLEQVGDDGITLTQAGYLPPRHVEAVATILHLEDSWIGKNNREVQTYRVLEFRESTQRLGLLRKAHNTLTLTKAAARARGDAAALWRLITDALPLGLTSRGPEVRASLDAGLLLLLGIAAGLPTAERQHLISTCLTALGWRADRFTPLSDHDVRELLRPTLVVLQHVRAIPSYTFARVADDELPQRAGAAVARAALGI